MCHIGGRTFCTVLNHWRTRGLFSSDKFCWRGSCELEIRKYDNILDICRNQTNVLFENTKFSVTRTCYTECSISVQTNVLDNSGLQERFTLGVTAILTMAVLSLVVSEKVPHSSTSIPLLGPFSDAFLCVFVLGSNGCCYWTGHGDRPVPYVY